MKYGIALFVGLLFQTGWSIAAERVALVVGNSSYQHVPELLNPGHDAGDLAGKLRALDFEVIEALDLDQTEMRASVGRFARALEGASVGLFFYAGHGLQISGDNYLVPIDAELSGEADVYVQLLNLRDVLAVMEAAVPTRLVLLDACRDNPLAKSLARSMPASRSTAIGQGLARIDAAQGTLIAYATAPEATAADGQGRNSPFTAALLDFIDKPGLEARQVLTRVRQSVIDATSGAQVPWDSSSLTGDFYFRLEFSNAPLPQSTTTQRTSTAIEEESSIGLNASDRRQIQEMLAMLGFDPGTIDGRFGPATRRAINRWQSASNLPPSGFLDPSSYTELLTRADKVFVARQALLSGDAFAAISMQSLLDADQGASDKLIDLTGDFLALVEDEAVYGESLRELRGGELWPASDFGWEFLDESSKSYNPNAGARLFAYAAAHGLDSAYSALGWVFYAGIGVEIDMEASYRYYEMAANASIADGYLGMGMHHHWGAGTREVDMATAIANYERAAEGEAWWAMVALGDIFREGHNGVEIDTEKAGRYYRMVTEGDPPNWAASALQQARDGLRKL